MSEEKLDIERIMAGIRAEIRESIVAEQNPGASRSEAPGAGDSVSPLVYSEELNYLNQNWQNWFTPIEPTSHRPISGSIVVRIKRFILNTVWTYFLKDYFDEERRFQMNLVRFLNATARAVDAQSRKDQS